MEYKSFLRSFASCVTEQSLLQKLGAIPVKLNHQERLLPSLPGTVGAETNFHEDQLANTDDLITKQNICSVRNNDVLTSSHLLIKLN